MQVFQFFLFCFFAELGIRCVPATVLLLLLLLHLPFVYFKVRKGGERMVGEKTHIFSSLRVLLCSP